MSYVVVFVSLVVTLANPIELHLPVDASQEKLQEPGSDSVPGFKTIAGSADLRHPWGAYSVAFSPDGKYLASAGGSNGVRLWNPKSGKLAKEIKLSDSLFLINLNYALEFSGDSQHLYVTGESGILFKLDVEQEEIVYTATVGKVTALAISKDGKLIVVGSPDGVVRLLSAESGGPLRHWQLSAHRVYSVDISPDGSLVAAGSQAGKISVWNAGEDDRLRYHLPQAGDAVAKRVGLLTSSVYSVQFLDDGAKLLSRARARDLQTKESTIVTQLWDAETGGLEQTIQDDCDRVGGGLATTRDGRRIVVQSDNGIRVFDRRTNEFSVRLASSTGTRLSPNWDESLAVSPDGKLVAAAGSGFDRTGMDVRVWSLDTGERLFESPHNHTSQIRAVDASSDGSRFLTAGGERINIWNAASGEIQRTINFAPQSTSVVCAACFSADSSALMAIGRYMPPGATAEKGALKCWDAATGDLKYSVENLYSSIEGLALSPNGKRGFFAHEPPDNGGNGDKIVVFDTRTGELLASTDAPHNALGGWHFVDDDTLGTV